ncbi:hypothetical protein V5O48_010169 [Marasmius crinis-equi]|uniref:Uncharacterized protein n=1 Tax=Marasmius crinis-equi TaxID=585013 RepID=A0ABR3F923_9AGAR
MSWIGRQIDSAHARSATRYRRVLLLIIESGAIYSSAVLIEIILYFAPNNGFYIVYDPIAQLVSIVPTMIIILTTLGMTSNDLTNQIQQTTRGLPAPGGGGGPRTRAGPRVTSTTFTLESRPHFAARTQGSAFDEDSESQLMTLPEIKAELMPAHTMSAGSVGQVQTLSMGDVGQVQTLSMGSVVAR